MIAEQITDPLAHHGEGPIWDPHAQALRWVDMLAGDVLTLRSGEEADRCHVGDVAAAIRPRTGGGLVVAVERGFLLVWPDGRMGAVHEAFTASDVRMNDGGCDPQGRFYCGSMAYDASPGRGALYRFDPDGTITLVLDDVTISNGMAWSADGGLLYYIDSPTGRVDAFSFDPDRADLSRRRPVVRIPEDAGMPDGMAVDADGGLWVALWGGGAVHRYTPDGRLDTVVRLPVTQVTACAFGGADLETLFITTSRQRVEAGEQPAAGALFTVTPGVRGLAPHMFAG